MRGAKDKNENFRNQIRNRQKQQLFRQHRLKLQNQSENNASQSVDLLQQLISYWRGNNNNNIADIDGMLIRISEDISPYCQSNKNKELTCMRMMDKGVHMYLMDNLKKGLHLEGTLILISNLLSHNSLKVAERFVARGLLDQITRLSAENPAFVHICMNILGNVIFQDTGNAEILLENNVHRILFNIFRREQNLILTSENKDRRQSIIWALVAFLQIDDPSNYEDQFIEILEFLTKENGLLQIYPKLIIQAIFLVGYSFREKTKALATHTLAKILSQSANQSQNLKSLLITIKLFSPLQDFPYNYISNICATGPTSLTTYCLHILHTIVKTNELNIRYIPVSDEIWWLKIFNNSIRNQDKDVFIKILRLCGVHKVWAIQIVKQLMQNYSKSLLLMEQVLTYLEEVIYRAENSQVLLKTHSIPLYLENIYESKNYHLQQKAEHLLTFFNQSSMES